MQNLLTKLQIPAGIAINGMHVSKEMEALLNLPLTPILKQSKAVLLQINNQKELNHFFPIVFEHINAQSIVWIIYPKKTGNITTDLTRDIGWGILSQFKYRGIRLISINDDYTAMRVKPINTVKKQIIPAYSEIDTINRVVILPKSVTKHQRFHSNLEEKFNRLSYTIKKELVLSILVAKKEETRLTRIEKLIDFLKRKQ